MLLDELLPEYEFYERHRIVVDASPDRALEAVKQATPGEMPLVRLLFAIRSLPARVRGKRGLPAKKTEPLYEQMLASGFVLLAEEPDREVVVGKVGQMFKPGGEAPTICDAQEFAAFEKPGYAKAAMNFSVLEVNGRTELTTETRIMTTNSVAKRQFGRYWRIIRLGSAPIRRSWLFAAKHRAGHGAGPRPDLT